MKIRFLFLIPSILLLTSCSGWFQPPPPHDHWRLHNSRALFPNSDPQGRIKFLDRRQKDMSDCGMDFVSGERGQSLFREKRLVFRRWSNL